MEKIREKIRGKKRKVDFDERKEEEDLQKIVDEEEAARKKTEL